MRNVTPVTDLFPGSYLTFAQVAAALPPGTRGRVNPSTIFRWVTRGIRLRDGSRLKLQSIRIGGRYVVSVEDLKDFIARQQPDANESAPAPRSPAARRRASESAARQLEAAGI